MIGISCIVLSQYFYVNDLKHVLWLLCNFIYWIREIFVLTFKAHGPHCVWSVRLECRNKYFLVCISSSVNKSIILIEVYHDIRELGFSNKYAKHEHCGMKIVQTPANSVRLLKVLLLF